MAAEVEIRSRDFWFKIVDMLQQNWALIDSGGGSRTTVYFIDDRSGVFDRLTFSSDTDAAEALRRNGFKRFAGGVSVHDSIRPPQPPFAEAAHPNGPIYSSGRFWR
jgi:hypothetical protein